MDDFIEVLQKCALFDGIAPRDLKAMLGCLGGRVTAFDTAAAGMVRQKHSPGGFIPASGVPYRPPPCWCRQAI